MVYYEHYFVPVDAVSDLDPCELEILERLIVERSPEVYVEVGVGHLGTLSSVARTVEKHNLACRCIGIDAFGSLPRDERGENSHEGDVIRIDDARRHLTSLGLDDICSLHQGDSSRVLAEVMPSLVASSKVVFIDANHSYAGCLADYRAVAPWLVDGDLLAFHDSITSQHPDYGRGPRGVIEDHVLDDPDFRLLALPPADAVLTEGESTLGLFECVRPRAATFATAGFLPAPG